MKLQITFIVRNGIYHFTLNFLSLLSITIYKFSLELLLEYLSHKSNMGFMENLHISPLKILTRIPELLPSHH